MSERHDPTHSQAAEKAAREADLERLRRLLGVADEESVYDILNRLDDPEIRARDLSGILPDAVMLSARQGDELGNALEPAVQRAVHSAIQRDPRPFAGALYPAMAPAIRRAIAETLRGMVQSLNEMLEHSLSIRALRWRWQAWRNQQSFAEVVLSHSLIFRVEQAFLIHRETGLLLQHVVDQTAEAQDPDLVSSMLTAIQDFAHDSFAVDEQAALEGFRVGNLTVWLVQGRDAVLAVAIRGNAPESLRADLREHLRAIHLRFYDELSAFDGDAAQFEQAREALHSCLVSRYQQPPSRSPWIMWLVMAVVVAAVGIWTFSWIQERRQWQTFYHHLEAAPGIVVTSYTSSDGRRLIRGLRDPLSEDPDIIAARNGLADSEVDFNWEAFTSLDQHLVLQRAIQALEPPDNIALQLHDGVLTASGTAPEGWLERASALAVSIPGVRAFRHIGRLTHPGQEATALARRSEACVMRFPSLSTRLLPEDIAVVDALVSDLTKLITQATTEGWSAEITLIGHADSTGSESLNIDLSKRRAEAIRDALVEQGISAERITVVGVGSSQPSIEVEGATSSSTNRRVGVKIDFKREAE